MAEIFCFCVVKSHASCDPSAGSLPGLSIAADTEKLATPQDFLSRLFQDTPISEPN